MKKISIFHVMLFLADVAAGAVAGGIAAAIFIPLCISVRGYFAVGAEWFFITIAAYAGYSAFNNLVFNELLRRH